MENTLADVNTDALDDKPAEKSHWTASRQLATH